MVVVLPWWRDPVRLVEKAALLDELSGGRFILGIGRGSAQREYEGFGISQDESRVRFDEIAEMVIQGLEQGYCEYDGEFIKQKKVRVRPTATRSFKGRRYGAAISPGSCEIGARLGLGLLINPQKPWEQIEEDIAFHESRDSSALRVYPKHWPRQVFGSLPRRFCPRSKSSVRLNQILQQPADRSGSPGVDAMETSNE